MKSFVTYGQQAKGEGPAPVEDGHVSEGSEGASSSSSFPGGWSWV